MTSQRPAPGRHPKTKPLVSHRNEVKKPHTPGMGCALSRPSPRGAAPAPSRRLPARPAGTGSNRGGDRQANAALRRIAVTRLRCDQRTRDYLDRRTAEGRPAKRPSAASSATSPARSTTSPDQQQHQPPQPSTPRLSPLDKHRGIRAVATPRPWRRSGCPTRLCRPGGRPGGIDLQDARGQPGGMSLLASAPPWASRASAASCSSLPLARSARRYRPPVTVYHSSASRYCTRSVAWPSSVTSVARVSSPVTTPTSSVITPPGPGVKSPVYRCAVIVLPQQWSGLVGPAAVGLAVVEHGGERGALRQGDAELVGTLHRDPAPCVRAPVPGLRRLPRLRTLVALRPVHRRRHGDQLGQAHLVGEALPGRVGPAVRTGPPRIGQRHHVVDVQLGGGRDDLAVVRADPAA